VHDGATVRFVIGYVIGTEAGPQGYEELPEPSKTTSSSRETRAMPAGGDSVLRDVLPPGRRRLAERLGEPQPCLSRAA